MAFNMSRVYMNYKIYKKQNATTGSVMEDVSERGGGAVVIMSLFCLFILFMVYFHCYLKRQQRKQLDAMAHDNVFPFEWDTEDEWKGWTQKSRKMMQITRKGKMEKKINEWCGWYFSTVVTVLQKFK